jgi:hypothetical protein
LCDVAFACLVLPPVVASRPAGLPGAVLVSDLHDMELADTLEEEHIRRPLEKRPCRVCGKPTASRYGICLAHPADVLERVEGACNPDSGLTAVEFDAHVGGVAAVVMRARGE